MDHFNCHVAPFPNSGDHLYSQVGNAPPQKLRPIRPRAHQNGEPYCFFNMEDPVVPTIVFGSSLDDNDDAGNSLQRTKEPRSRNRRKKMGRKLRGLAEDFVKKVMEKQEEMHKQLVDVIEKNERERLMREEIWKQKEMERFQMDEEVTIREISRNFAVISSIHKLMGQEI